MASAESFLGFALYMDENGKIVDLADAFATDAATGQDMYAFIQEYLAANKGLKRLGPVTNRPIADRTTSMERPPASDWNEFLEDYHAQLEKDGVHEDYAALYQPRRTFQSIEVKKVGPKTLPNMQMPKVSYDVTWERMFENSIPLSYGDSKKGKKGPRYYQFIPGDVMHSLPDQQLLDSLDVFSQQIRYDYGDEWGDIAQDLYERIKRVAEEYTYGTGTPVALINRLHAVRQIAYLMRDPKYQTENSLKILKKIGIKTANDTGFLEPDWFKAENRRKLNKAFGRYFPLDKATETPIPDLFLTHDAYAWMALAKQHDVSLMRIVLESEAGPLHNPNGSTKVSKHQVLVDVVENMYRLLDYLDAHTAEEVGKMLDTIYDGGPTVHPICANLLSFAKPKKEVKKVEEFNQEKCRIIFVPSFYSILPGQVFFAQVDHLVKSALGRHPMDTDDGRDIFRNLAGFSPFYGNLRELFIRAALHCNEAYTKRKKKRVLRFSYSDNLYVCWYDEEGFHWVSLDGRKMEGQATVPKYLELMRFLMQALGHAPDKSTFSRGWQNYLMVLLPRISVEAFAILGSTLINTNWLGSGAPGTSAVNTSQWAFLDVIFATAAEMHGLTEDTIWMMGFSLGDKTQVDEEVGKFDAKIRPASKLEDVLRASQLSVKVESYIVWSPSDSNPRAPLSVPLDMLGFDLSSLEIGGPPVGIDALGCELNKERLYRMLLFSTKVTTTVSKKRRDYMEQETKLLVTAIRVIAFRLAFFLGAANDPMLALFVRWRMSRLIAGMGKQVNYEVSVSHLAELLAVPLVTVVGILQSLTENASTIPEYGQFLEFNNVDIDMYDDEQKEELDQKLRVIPTNPVKVTIVEDSVVLEGGGARQLKVKGKPNTIPNRVQEHAVTRFPYKSTRIGDVKQRVTRREIPSDDTADEIYDILRGLSSEFAANEQDGFAVLKEVPSKTKGSTRLTKPLGKDGPDVLVTYINEAVPGEAKDTPWWRTILFYAAEVREEVRRKIRFMEKIGSWEDILELRMPPGAVLAFFIYHKPGFQVFRATDFESDGVLREDAVDVSTLERRAKRRQQEARREGAERREYRGATSTQSRTDAPASAAARDSANRERRDRARAEARERKAARRAQAGGGVAEEESDDDDFSLFE